MPLITNSDGTRLVYPCTIFPSRYEGIYSGGNWLAFPTFYDMVPASVLNNEKECKEYFDNYRAEGEPFPIGKGASPGDAYDNLLDKMEKRHGTESST